MKKSLLLCSTALVASLSVNAGAMDFGNNVYGKANVSIGYNYRAITGQIKNLIDNPPYGEKTYKGSHGISLGLGYNVFFKTNDFVHLFVGMETAGQFDISGRHYFDGKKDGDNVQQYWELFRVNGKFGSKFNLNSNFAIMPYATIGFNIVRSSGHVVACTSPLECPYWYKYLVGLTTGAGADLLIKDRFSIGIEYRYVKVEKKFSIAPVDPVTKQVWKNHNISVKFGYHFF